MFLVKSNGRGIGFPRLQRNGGKAKAFGPAQQLIEQSISDGTSVDTGTTINFVISEGPAMPDYGDDATTSGGEPQP